MATYAIKWLKDKLGTKFFPVTHLKAVRDDNNTNLESILSDKQDELVSGVNIKTINGNSILGSGNMDVSGGGGGGQANVIESISVNGTGQAVDANKNVDLNFKTVNNNSISGTGNINIAVPTKVSDLTNDAGYITGYTENDPVFSASVAAEITNSDITNWNGKTSNIGTITSVKMNGTTVSSSGEADLGTVITSHQDISGKADKSATVSTVTYNTTSKKITKTINGTTTDVVTAAKIVTDGGGITSETDPTVPSWAKASSKPSYTASEVGAVPTTRTVNGKALSADITLSASDVSALPSSTAIPSKTSDLTNDSGYLTSADISGVYKYKGSKTNYSQLPSTGNVTGDVWNVVNAYGDYPAGTNFSWDGTTWDALGGSVDLSGYVPTSRTINGKALSSNITLSASDVSALPSSTSIPAALSDLSDDSTHRLVTDTEKSTWNSKGTYSKPSGGIPKTDLASAVQTSLGLADTALQSYTESDPVFTASAAHDISSTDISNWNAKGTYSKPSGGIPKTDLASAVQTSLGKADTALQSYTETDPVFAASAAHGITSSDISTWNSAAPASALDDYLPLTGGIVSGSLGVGVSETSTIPLDVYNTNSTWALRAYSLYNDVRSTFYASSGTGSGLWCGTSLTASNKYVAQFRSGITNVGSGGSAVLYVRADGNVGIDNEAPSATLDVTGTMNVTGAATLGSTLDVTGNIVAGGQIRMPNNTGLYMKDASASIKNVLYISTTNNLHVGLDTASAGYATYINGNTITFRYGTSRAIGMVLNTSGNVGIGTTTPSEKLQVSGVVKCTSVDTSSDERLKEKVDDININVEDIAAAPNITFKWKNEEDRRLFGGTYAQYWENITPYYVRGDEEKTLEYGALAVSCSIELAKEVVQLKEENARLKKELAEIKDIINKLKK